MDGSLCDTSKCHIISPSTLQVARYDTRFVMGKYIKTDDCVKLSLNMDSSFSLLGFESLYSRFSDLYTQRFS